MLRYLVLGVIGLAAGGAWAQQETPQTAAPMSASAQASKAVVPMEDPRPGDHWTYEVRDEITGKISATRENAVTEVTPAGITVRYKNIDNNNQGINVYDRSWNVVEEPPWKFSPNDGGGIQTPLTVGKTWPIRSNSTNSSNGNAWKRSGTSKIVGQESITTKAGTFDTFKIETTYTSTNVANPTLVTEIASTTWYAPAIDHWVKRTFVSRANKHLQTNNLLELIEYGRKQ